ncbi:MAG: hypothetical protein J6S67_00820 [Methanobrevibacter sp.]|nr:hypothetical protein [Methanobrevibacter sp.]
MIVNLYKFSKRPNSTKQPAVSDATRTTVNNVELKENTSMLTPTLLISKGVISGFNPVMFNYADIAIWQKYYFIKNWRWLNGIWEADLEIDVLATFKTEIGNTTAYILRCNSQFDTNIIDVLYPAKTNVSIQKINVASSWYGVAPSGGSYVIGCINYQSNDRVGAVSYYAVTPSQLGQILNFLFTSNIYNASGIDEIGEGLYKAFFNPFQYFVSCTWFPFSTPAFGFNEESVKVGYWNTGVNGITVTSLAEKTFVTATIPNHPQISRGKYLNHAPYTRLTLYLPPFGSIPIDTNFREIGNYLYSAVLIDHITGLATLRVSISESSSSLDEYQVITERNGMIGVPIQLAQLMPDYVGSLHSVINGAGDLLGAIATSNAGSLVKALGNVVDLYQSQMPQVTTSGSNGSFTECINYPVLIAEFIRIADENRTEFGRPLYTNKKINTLSGFVKVGEADHAFSGTDTENQMINKFLTDGFFYE